LLERHINVQTSTLKPLIWRRWQLSRSAYARLTIANAIAIWLLIVLGGLVRVTYSGTGCGEDWPLCNGRLLPRLQFNELIEWTHRLVSLLVGVLLLVTVAATLIWYRRERKLLIFGLLTPFSYLLQAALGAMTVILHLDHSWVAAHMANSMILIAWATLLAFYARRQPAQPGRASRQTVRLRALALIGLFFTFAAMGSGSAVIGMGANLACPTWPQCSPDQIFPVSSEQWVSFGHRLSVGIANILLIVLGVAVWRTRRHERPTVRVIGVLAGLFALQVFLGAFTVFLDAPAFLKGAHLAVAAATWSTLVITTALIWRNLPTVPDSDEHSDLQAKNPALVQKELVSVGDKMSMLQTVRLYLSLMRLNVIPLLLVPTGAAMLMAAAQQPGTTPNLIELLILTLTGGTLAAGGAHALNQYYERDLDARMRRTRRRGIVTGQLRPRNALIFGLALTTTAVILLALTVNWLAAALSLGGHFFYTFVYTLWLKRTTAQNIVIGGAAGAVPPLVGWAAVTGRLDLPALLFFAIIFFWTPAHFWALALVRREDYEAAGVPMLPVVRGEAYTRRSILVYSLLLVGVSVLPVALGTLGWLYLLIAVGLGGWFVRQSWRLQLSRTNIGAWRLFKFSNYYLALLYAVMVIDRLIVLGN
jgi:heme o synthase